MPINSTFSKQGDQWTIDNDSSSSSYLGTNKQFIPSTKDETPREKQPNLLHTYSTPKNSKAAAFKWMKTMKSKDISKVQRACKEPMMMLGYNLMTKLSESKRDVGFPMIVKSSEEVWTTLA